MNVLNADLKAILQSKRWKIYRRKSIHGYDPHLYKEYAPKIQDGHNDPASCWKLELKSEKVEHLKAYDREVWSKAYKFCSIKEQHPKRKMRATKEVFHNKRREVEKLKKQNEVQTQFEILDFMVVKNLARKFYKNVNEKL